MVKTNQNQSFKKYEKLKIYLTLLYLSENFWERDRESCVLCRDKCNNRLPMSHVETDLEGYIGTTYHRKSHGRPKFQPMFQYKNH